MAGKRAFKAWATKHPDAVEATFRAGFKAGKASTKLPKLAAHAIEGIDKTMKHGWAQPLGDNDKEGN